MGPVAGSTGRWLAGARVAERGGGLLAGVADGEGQKIWEKPRNNAKNPTQNRIKNVRWASAYTRSDPDTQNASSTSRIPVTSWTHQYGFTGREATPWMMSKVP